MADNEIDPYDEEYGYRKNPPRTRKKNRYYDEFDEPMRHYRSRGGDHHDRAENRGDSRIYASPRHHPSSRQQPTPLPPPRLDVSPQKIRKSNKPTKQLAGGMPWRSPYPNSERRQPQLSALKLRNVLKLPKAHKWVFYEWFYSNLDRPLLLGENDFRICLRESYPQLKTRKLTRTQWSLIRRLMGKPRRCSAAFFEEERRALLEKRNKIRTLQAKRAVELEYLRDLPDDMHVPMPLVIGTGVTARVRYPTDGLYTGVVDAIDSINHCYRITFDKEALGTRSIPDYEVLSIQPQETIPLSAYKTQHKASRNLFMSPARLLAQSALQGVRHHLQHAKHGHIGDSQDCSLCQADNISSSPLKSSLASIDPTAQPLPGESHSGAKLLLNESDIYGGYPMKFLVMVTKLSKILEVKKLCLEELRDCNTEAELMLSTRQGIPLEFQHTYLTLIVHLERLNKELSQYLAHVLQYANEIAQEHGVMPLEQASDLKQRAEDDAYDLVTQVKNSQGQRLKNMKSLDLITKLTGLLVQVRSLYDQEGTAFECSSVFDTLRELKANLHSSNVTVFENNVEVPMIDTMSGLYPLGNLNSFFYSHPNHTQYI